jgi:hypothetical protein
MAETRSTNPCHFRFQCLTDFFMPHSSMGTDSQNRVVRTPNGAERFVHLLTPAQETDEHFGLLPGSYLQDGGHKPSWQEFARHIEQLNQSASNGVSYKAVFVTRHGQGFHNVTEAKYGTEEWDVRTDEEPQPPLRASVLNGHHRENGRSWTVTA